ncbi:hypothetical protein GQ53DRAFT_620505, partial [Thozetella sp. PMI_491]
MISQRVGASALRQVARKNNAFFTANLARVALASNLPTTQIRPVATQKITAEANQELLAEQRRRRPISPHLEIYNYGQTWFGHSAWQRITGSIFSGGLYVFATAYLAAPLLGWHLETASLTAAFATLPVAIKGGFKFLLAWPFVYHSVNGVRHLLWDMRLGFANPKERVTATGWAVWGTTLVLGLGLAFA